MDDGGSPRATRCKAQTTGGNLPSDAFGLAISQAPALSVLRYVVLATPQRTLLPIALYEVPLTMPGGR